MTVRGAEESTAALDSDGCFEAVTRTQTLIERPPARGLVSHLACVWVQEVAVTSAPYEHRIVPDGTIELLHELGSAPRIVGAGTRPRTRLVAPGATLVGLRFRPGAAHRLFGIRSSELTDIEVPLDFVWGHTGRMLSSRLAEASSAKQAVDGLTRAVAAGLEKIPAVDPLINGLVASLRSARPDGISAIASSLYVSDRQLRRRCEEAVGLSPKALQRILRFQRFQTLSLRVLHNHQAQAVPDLAQLAVQAGYADQSHLSRESMRISGRTPAALILDFERHCVGHHDHGHGRSTTRSVIPASNRILPLESGRLPRVPRQH
jgi:AraC-like DNA-binding protein